MQYCAEPRKKVGCRSAQGFLQAPVAHEKNRDEREPAVKRQRTITDCDSLVTNKCPNTVSAEARNELCKEVVSVFAATNIPLSKLDHPAFRTFLQKHVVNGGAIPKSKQLQECYLLRELDAKKEIIRRAVECKPLAVICDEMSDDIGRFVLNILVAPMESDRDNKVKSYLLDTVFLPRTDHAEVAGAVIRTLVNWNIEFSNVMTFNTDNAAYMKKAYHDVIKGVMPNCTHITCLAHIMNLLGEAFRKPFENSNKYVKAANAIFWHAGARKARYLRYLSQANPDKTPKLAPNPIGTRWNCWYDAVSYHRDNMDIFISFVQEEIKHNKVACDSLVYLADLTSDQIILVKGEMNFIVKKCEDFVVATDLFQSQSPVAVKAWSKLESLKTSFADCGISMREAEQFFTEDTSSSQKYTLQALYCQAISAVATKLEKYMSPEGQPGVQFLKELQFLDPTRLVTLDVTDFLYLPGLSTVPDSEISRYREIIGPRAVKVSGGLPVDLTVFWNSVTTDLPKLSECARKYIFTCINSADAERSFSLYNLLFSDRRRSLNEDNLKALMFLYYNSFISYESLL